MALDSVPVKTTAASGLFYGGKGLMAIGKGLEGLYAPSKPAAAPTFAFDRQPLQLEANVPGNAGYEEDFSQGSTPPRNVYAPPAPRNPMALPSSTTPGTVQPMIGVKAPAPYPPLAEDFARNRTVPVKFNGPPSNPLGIPRGYLNAANPPRVAVKPPRIPKKPAR
jgi:hypothetical protein